MGVSGGGGARATQPRLQKTEGRECALHNAQRRDGCVYSRNPGTLRGSGSRLPARRQAACSLERCAGRWPSPRYRWPAAPAPRGQHSTAPPGPWRARPRTATPAPFLPPGRGCAPAPQRGRDPGVRGHGRRQPERAHSRLCTMRVCACEGGGRACKTRADTRPGPMCICNDMCDRHACAHAHICAIDMHVHAGACAVRTRCTTPYHAHDPVVHPAPRRRFARRRGVPGPLRLAGARRPMQSWSHMGLTWLPQPLRRRARPPWRQNPRRHPFLVRQLRLLLVTNPKRDSIVDVCG